MEQKVEWIEQIIEKKKNVRLMEPCDCGAQVRHNNGGNYHQLLAVDFNKSKFRGGWYSREYDTCELVEHPGWQKKTENEIRELLTEAIEAGFYEM